MSEDDMIVIIGLGEWRSVRTMLGVRLAERIIPEVIVPQKEEFTEPQVYRKTEPDAHGWSWTPGKRNKR